MKKIPWFEIILIIAVMSMSLHAALSDAQNFSLRWFTRDDAYYYFKVAQNISEGHGSSFDGINKTNGYHPLWMLICVPIFALARFDLILPLRILLLVMSGFSVSTAILLYRLLGKIFVPAIGGIAALYWVFSFDILISIYQNGLESGIAAFFVVLFIYKLYQFEGSWRTTPFVSLKDSKETSGAYEISRKQLAMLGALAALMVFSRLDLIFFAGMAGLWIVFRGHLLRFFLPLDIISAVVSVFLAFIIRLDLPEYYEFSDIAIIMAGLGLAIKLLSAFSFGLYQRKVTSNFRSLLIRLLASTLISSALLGVIMMIIASFGKIAGFPRTIILIDFGFTLLFFGLSRLIFVSLHSSRDHEYSNDSSFTDLRGRWKKWMQDGLVYYGITFGALGIYMLWSKFTFGTFSPVSGQVKRWWGSFPARVYGGATRSPLEFFGISYQDDGLAWTPIANSLGDWVKQFTELTSQTESLYTVFATSLLIVIYLILLLNKEKSRTAITQLSLIPLVGGSILQTVYYHAGGYSAYKEWYWITQRITSVLAICLVIGLLFTIIRKIKYSQYIAWAMAIYFGFNMGQAYWAGIQNTMRYNRWSADTPLMEIATLLEQNTEPGSLIGFTGGGNVGYFIQDRTIVNMDGLINSHEYLEALQAGKADEFLQNIGLDYVLANPGILDRQPYDGQFNEYLEAADVIYGGKQLLRYRAPK